ncbi:hypothetical protein ACI782_02900 [Geodermatophilus sp. SYSU D00703]
MRKRLAAVLATVGLTVGGVAVATPAQADVRCTITNFSPRSVVVGLSPVTRTFGVSTSGCSTVRSWTVDESGYLFYTYKSSTQDTFNPNWLRNSDAGAKDVIVSVANGDWTRTERTFLDGFRLLRRTAWQSGTFNASPEPATKGGQITVKGRLLVADWDANWGQGAYVPYAGRTIQVQFRTPDGTYRTVKTVTTDRNGWVNTTVPASTTGVWRLQYKGNSVAAGSVPVGDTVQVR